MEANVGLILAALLTLLLISRQCARALWHLVWKPYVVTRWFGRQGIRGPPYRFAVGSLPELKRMLVAGRRKALDAGSHNYISAVQPFFQKWASDYGKTFLYWLGPIPAICSTDMELVKQVLADRTDLFQKDYLNPRLEIILGKGVIFANGDDWKRHRKVVHPVFNHENIKSMAAMVSEGTRQMMERWCNQIQKGNGHHAETDMRRDSDELTLGVIARVIFGKDYREAWGPFVALKELQALAVYAFVDPPIPGFRYLPTRRNRRSRQLDKLVTSKITELIEARIAEKDDAGSGGGYGDDLLGLMLQAWSDAETLSTQEIIGECKTFFAAGQDTSANLLAWAMFLLSSYPQWQEKVREEVLREFNRDDGEVPSFESLSKLKLLNMFLLETLRLYGPVAFLQRKTASDTVLANINVPKGTVITIPITMLHRDKDVWGPDADEFNPTRFENGVSRAAKHPNALLAFSYGPRVCSGQNFAMIESQTVMAMILRRFSFSLSPKYVHKPTSVVTLMPKYGLPLVVRNLQDG